MGRKGKATHSTIYTTNYPDHIIEKVARCLMPDILACFESEEGLREFEKWKAMQDAKNCEEPLAEEQDEALDGDGNQDNK